MSSGRLRDCQLERRWLILWGRAGAQLLSEPAPPMPSFTRSFQFSQLSALSDGVTRIEPMLNGILISTRSTRSLGATMHAAAFFALNRW